MSESPRYCVLIPLFNNHRTIADVVRRVQAHLSDVIVVDDGSVDGGADALAPAEGLLTLRHDRNRGKGAALKTGADRARELGFTHVVQLDADGQHDAGDIPRFVEASRREPDAVIVGERTYREEDDVPGSSLFGRRFSAMWYRIETGDSRPDDTQCGFRVYPLQRLDLRSAWGNRMEFDHEIMVRARWQGLVVRPVSTQVRYFSGDERVTSFRPFWDNLRFSVMHCLLTNGSVLWRIGRLFAAVRDRLRGRG